ncbi:MAG TPA: hypothetical protein VJT70_09795 [Sphingomicrobium sp.]|nr:hypothetical protein [Sphingomicrobium sp.]
MNHDDIIRRLLAAAAEPAQRNAARLAWAREMLDQWSAAQRAMDDRCSAAVGHLSEEEFERLCDAEQAKVDATRAQIDAVIERDIWPRELYFGCV